MRVRVLQDHSSTLGPKTEKYEGDEFTVRAEDAEAFVEAGLLKEVPASKGDKAS